MRGACELVDAPLVTAAEEFAGKESGDAGLGHLNPDQPGADGDGVAVIVLAGEGRGKRLGDLRAAARGIAVCGNGDADARSADDDSALGSTVGERFGQQGTEPRVIDAFGTVCAEVDDLVTVVPEPVRELVLHLVAGMIGR